MAHEEARRLAEFVTGNDERYVAKARREGVDSIVLLTQAEDGMPLEPVTGLAQPHTERIARADPGHMVCRLGDVAPDDARPTMSEGALYVPISTLMSAGDLSAFGDQSIHRYRGAVAVSTECRSSPAITLVGNSARSFRPSVCAGDFGKGESGNL